MQHLYAKLCIINATLTSKTPDDFQIQAVIGFLQRSEIGLNVSELQRMDFETMQS